MKRKLTCLAAFLLAANSIVPVSAAETELLHSGFEEGLSGWQARGGASVAVSSDAAAEGSASALVSNRSDAWNGISYAVGSICPAGTKCSVTAQVMQKSGESVHFKMTMQYGSGNSAVYDTFAEGDAADGEWLRLSAENYTVGDGSDPVLYIETEGSACDFYLDEAVVIRTGRAPSQPGKYKQGDADHNGKVEAADANVLCDYLLTKDSDVYEDTADLDGDGALTATDLSMLKDMILNPPPEPEHDTDYMSKIRDQITPNVPSSALGKAEGTLEHITYFSKTANRDKGANVWLPPGYDKNEKYPVFYVNHGYGGDESAMVNGMGVREIATSLIKSGDAVPMIIVFTDQYSDPAHPKQTGNGQADVYGYDLFVEDLPGSLMPYIEEHYPVKTGRENTAIAGFSMGGRESLYIGMKCCDKIGYIGAGAPAPGIFKTKDQFMDHPGVMTKEEIRIDPPYSPYLLLIAGGTSDNMVGTFPDQYHQLFDEHGTENIFLSVPGGGHDSKTVTPLMYNFIRFIFKA
ncbi:MAG: carbohydrate binding domain-containing protein [Oscillospiraceae bacterium]|nr:carbohydrate binding domain-containing protein [Oscillospiraceae bacterium]